MERNLVAIPSIEHLALSLVSQYLFDNHFKRSGFVGVKAAAEELIMPPSSCAQYFLPLDTVDISSLRRPDFYAASARQHHEDLVATIGRFRSELDALEARSSHWLRMVMSYEGQVAGETSSSRQYAQGVKGAVADVCHTPRDMLTFEHRGRHPQTTTKLTVGDCVDLTQSETINASPGPSQ